jgi:hypothetical protein
MRKEQLKKLSPDEKLQKRRVSTILMKRNQQGAFVLEDTPGDSVLILLLAIA